MTSIYDKFKLITSLDESLKLVANGLWPPSCSICRRAVSHHQMLCGDCWSELPLLEAPCCRYCGISVQGSTDPICIDCWNTPRPWSHGYAATHYEGISRHITLAFKNRGAEHYAPIIASLILRNHREKFSELDFITEMPLHWRRKLSRGYNQAGLICHHLSKQANIAFQSSVVHRDQYTKKQGKHSDFDARHKNVENVFSIKPACTELIRDKHIGLVDDVFTSGASLTEVSTVLLKSGAREVSVFVFARAGVSD